MNANTEMRREDRQRKLFPNGSPRLWCPALTHFRQSHEPDTQRMYLHLQHLSLHTKALLVPGSTGEGWEMSDGDIRKVLDIVFEIAESLGLQILVGVLKTTLQEVLSCMQSLEYLSSHPAFVGFTVCPPKGDGLSQDEILHALRHVLERGWPTALYQLPQVTGNEMTPETVGTLAREYENFILFKDTSGFDRVAKSGADLGGVWMVRGAEAGGYAGWLRVSGGQYDGFLLSSANVFAKELARIIELSQNGRTQEATELAITIQRVVQSVFEWCKEIAVGNPFTNANKMLDHVMAFGSCWTTEPTPMLISGTRLPMALCEKVANLLEETNLKPAIGYALK
jgi:4-hydroxy-tetrahydrodipicolinate synthase